MDRRQFLKNGVLAAGGASLAPRLLFSRATSCSAPGKKVLILGAGLAGLVAGHELSQAGHDVTILEARMRAGGRVHTLRENFSDGLYAEAGAARIPDNHNLTLKYVKLFNLPLEPMYPNRLSSLRFDGGTRREVGIDGFTEALGDALGADLGGNPTKWSKIQGGSDLLPKAFAKKLSEKIYYGCAVVRIEQDPSGARVFFKRAGRVESMTADRVLCTIPYSVLRGIELPPTFSERKRDLIQNLEYVSVARVYVQTRTRFWEAKGLNGFALTRDLVEIWHPTWSQPGRRGILMTYARFAPGDRIGAMNQNDRISSTVDQLENIYPGLRDQFEGGCSKYWGEDEWSKGAWAGIGLRELLFASSPEGRVHFAGEHLSLFPSWMQGALVSGVRAVKEIVEAP